MHRVRPLLAKGLDDRFSDVCGKAVPHIIHQLDWRGTGLPYCVTAADGGKVIGAGLVAMQSHDAYLFLGVQWLDGKQVVALSVRKNGQDPRAGRVVASAPLAGPGSGKPVYLRLSIEGGSLSASYTVRRNAWRELAVKQDATFLSTKHAGGFVGTVIGLYNEQGE